mmetsp:Transcript_20188/g.55927  ORF Transcript_20188/g.55927 Transcript_20188/m.55927 type:complete len:219 (-) Transcript_20188:119-775(-)
MLTWFRFLLACGAHDRDHTNMRHQKVFWPDLEQELLQRLQVDGALYVPNCASQFDQTHVRPLLPCVDRSPGDIQDPVLDRVSDVRNHLDGFAEVVSRALTFYHLLVYLARGDAMAGCQRDIEKTLVVPQIQIDLPPILENVHLAMLEGAHRAGVDVQVWVYLNRRDSQPMGPQHHADGRDRCALAEARHSPASDDEVLHGRFGENVHAAARQESDGGR